MSRPTYSSGEGAYVGDLVDVGRGNGPLLRVVVVIPTQEAVAGFDASEWAYLENGVVLQDLKLLGLLHLATLDEDQILVRRA